MTSQNPKLASLLSFLAFDNGTEPEEAKSQSVQTNENSNESTNDSTNDRCRDSALSSSTNSATFEKATIVYHESAQSIVFRDHLRRAHDAQKNDTATTTAKVRNSNNNGSSNARANASARRTNTNTKNSKTNNTSKDDVSIISNSSKTSHDHCSYVGTTNDAVQTESVISIASSFETETETETEIETGRNQHLPHDDAAKPQVIIANYTPEIDPLPPLALEPHNEFSELLLSNPYAWRDGDEGPDGAVRNSTVWNTMSVKECVVAEQLLEQKCAVKTIKNADLTAFVQRFPVKDDEMPRRWLHPADFKDASKMERIQKYREEGDRDGDDAKLQFHSFHTSLSLLPPLGLKMRCYGSTKSYTTGVVFALPTVFSKVEDEDMAVLRTHTWAWPAGYAAKTEFNISPHGELMNGRKEALVSITQLRSNNHSYIYDTDYELLGKIIKGGFHTLPYNEILSRVGGVGRSLNGEKNERTFDDGLGLPVALFVRTPSYGDLTALLRLRARLGAVLGKECVRGIPLLLIDPDIGTRVLTEKLQKKLLTTMTNSLNPFQNPHLKHQTQINAVSETHFQQKLEELLDLDDDNIRDVLTTEECARLAGGYGATDESVAHLLIDAMVEDHEEESNNRNGNHSDGDWSHNKLQHIVNEGLSAAVRSGDFNTSRQLLILYTLVASRCKQEKKKENKYHAVNDESISIASSSSKLSRTNRRLARQITSLSSQKGLDSKALVSQPSSIPAPPPPPPLDTDRLRSATNSDGLLAVLGAAEVLKALQTGDAAKRALEAADSIEEWIEKSEHSIAFRLASWRDLTAAQGDLKIATENHSNFMAFLSNKAINNRTRFAAQLRHSVANTSFEGIEFLKEIHAILETMHSPCLRLELLQFILGLDNRYSVAHVARSVELAATCLNISASDDVFAT